MMDFIDPVCVPDVFATDLACVEDLGGVFRFSFATRHGSEIILATRVCLLTSAVQDARLLTAVAVARSINPVFNLMRVRH